MKRFSGWMALCLGALIGGSAMAGTVTGTAGYRERIALPPGAVLEVQLLDVSRMDVAATVLSSRRYAMGAVPQAFELAYDDALIDPAMSYSVSARILMGDKLLFTTDTHNPVLTRDAGDSVDLMLVKAAPAGLDGRDWALREISGVPVEGPGMPGISFEAGGHYFGRGGCNSFQGEAEIGPGRISFPDNMGMTMMACSQEAEALDRRFVEALTQVTGYVLEADALSLTDASGSTVLRFVSQP